MDVVDPIVVYYLWKRKEEREKKKWVARKYWVHPAHSDRFLTGHFYIKHPKLQQYPEKFFNYYRMSKPSFEELLCKIRCVISRKDTNMRAAIPPEEMLAITLRYLATGNSLVDMAEKYSLGRSTTGYIVRRVCIAVWRVMKEECIPTPTREGWQQISNGFESRAYFPHCIGAIDGKHIRITKPYRSGSLFFNYKHYFSIVLIAVADSQYRFTYVHTGSYGKEADCNIFKNSLLWKGLVQQTLEVPHPQPFTGVPTPMPYVLVGDEAFGLTNFLLTPYSGHNLDRKKKIFNFRLSTGRRYVECTFGILANKWRIFHRPIDLSVDFADDIVKACCVLHNFVRDRDGFSLEDSPIVEGSAIMSYEEDRRNASSNSSVQAIRNLYADYFVSDTGKVPWQEDMF